MEGKKKIKYIFLYMPMTLVGVVFCLFVSPVLASSDDLVITEIRYSYDEKEEGPHVDWIELYNSSEKNIILNKKSFGLIDEPEKRSSENKLTNTCHTLVLPSGTDIAIEPGDFVIITDSPEDFHKLFLNYEGDVLDSVVDLSQDGDTIKISFDRCATWIAELAYSKDWGGYRNGKTLEKIALTGIDRKENWRESSCLNGTPGEKLKSCEKPSEPSKLIPSIKVILSEIYPNPPDKGEKTEFIEILNQDKEPIDLGGWMIRDASKTGKFIFEDNMTLKPDEYFVIYRPESKIALNNSKESISLYNPQGKITSSVSYNKAPEKVSYNFDGKNWHWSKFLTPEKKNKFDDPPKIKITKPKNIFKNTAANFSVEAKDKETKHLKYAWDFGDGHKSYLKETSHKYLETGVYGITLTVSDASQSIEKSFDVTVKKYPRPKIEIVRVVPNPAGLDSEKEMISLLNDSGKRVNLLNYKIATGSKSLTNHLITTEIILNPEEEKIITRADSKIVLNNKEGKVALLYPDGKVADEVTYAKEKIEEDEIYAMLEGKWQWILPENKNEIAAAPQDDKGIVAGASTENEASYATFSFKYTLEDYFIFLNSLGFLRKFENENCCQKDYTYPSPAYLLTASL